jgi:hypothetical protein
MSGFGIMLAMFAIVLALVALIKLLAWVDRAREQGWRPLFGVKSFPAEHTTVMSRPADERAENVPSSLQTDGRQTADRPVIPKPTPEQMLDIFRVLRAKGIKRDDIAEVWRAAGLSLDTNLWTKAKPPAEEPSKVTPFADRPTDAAFYDDLIHKSLEQSSR